MKKKIENIDSKLITNKQDEKGKNDFKNNMKLFLVPSIIFYVLGGIYFGDFIIGIILVIEFLDKLRFLQKNDVGFGNYTLMQNFFCFCNIGNINLLIFLSLLSVF